jgi:hypothetical protein
LYGLDHRRTLSAPIIADHAPLAVSFQGLVTERGSAKLTP